MGDLHCEGSPREGTTRRQDSGYGRRERRAWSRVGNGEWGEWVTEFRRDEDGDRILEGGIREWEGIGVSRE